MRQILFEWNFMGEDAEGTAKHHVIHLKEFIAREKIESSRQEYKKVDDMLSSAMMVIDEETARKIKDVLRPHKAYVIE
ncbi:MAG: hypothetical protein MK078_15870 [Crocinitomicaceae bacterium]|nr:hypothetical protein [Crocinitomicaceae bacterium]